MRAHSRSLRALIGVLAGLGALLAALPAPSLAAADVTRVAIGFESACALRSDGGVSCWGTNSSNQLADGTDDPNPGVVRVTRTGGSLLTGVRRLTAGGRHYCTIQKDTTIRCWGDNGNGQTGVGSSDPVLRAITVKVNGSPLSGVKDITAGWLTTCALLVDGHVWCWGGAMNGVTGDGAEGPDRLVPVQVHLASGGVLSHATAIAAGGYHVCALLADRTMRCWGDNGKGQVGDGTHDQRLKAVKVRTKAGAILGDVRAIAAGGEDTCAVRGAERGLWCWGDNADSEIGDGTDHDRSTPVRVKLGAGVMTGVARVAMDYEHTCAIRSRVAWCWGTNVSGEVGDGTDALKRAKPVRVRTEAGSPFPATVTWIDVSDAGTCLVSGRRAWCFGENFEGQAGPNADSDQQRTPVRVPIS